MSRLDAALAYRPTTARCRRCRRRFPYDQMTPRNYYCKSCWRDYYKLRRYLRSTQ